MPNGAAAAHAAEMARRMREEEEDMTGYNKEDLEGWEFKIVRSITGRFKNYERVQELCREESKAGWELVEKFDDNRIRFKRRVERRSSDSHLDINPYRTRVGIGEGVLAAIILSAIFGGAGFAILAVFLMKRGRVEAEFISVAIPIIIIIVGALVVFGLRTKRR